jgi:dephospho-CoA kinase
MTNIIGLTGGIGSGKSIVAKVFSTLGIPVFNADSAAKELMQSNVVLKQKLIETFGDNIFTGNQLDRKFLADIVFSDKHQLEILNSIVHPFAIQAAKDWAAIQTAPYVIKEAALIFESGSSAGLAGVIGISAPMSIRIHRVMQRDNCTKQEVEKRMQSQISDTVKMRLCDWLIVNDDQMLVVPQVVALHENLSQQFSQQV